MTDSGVIEISGPSLEEAISKGLEQLGLARNEVIIEIVDEGNRGVLGLGQKDARVRLTPLRAPDPAAMAAAAAAESASGDDEPDWDDEPEPAPEPTPAPAAPAPPAAPAVETRLSPEAEASDDARMGSDVLLELLAHMGLDSHIDARQADPDDSGEEPPWVLDIQGRDLGILVGKGGDTLDALQYVTRLIVSRELQRRANIVVDVEGHKARREEGLRKLAHNMADQAKRLGRTMTLEPMPPNERRIIHVALRDDETVTTESVGAGDRRRVTIIPEGEE